MRVAQEQYLRQCFKEYTDVLRQCRHCGPYLGYTVKG
jgi:hypothetical protein